MPVILANQKQRNILSECNNSCYNLVKDEDETMKNETQQFVLQEYKELHGKMFLLSIDQSAMKYIKCKPLPCLLVQSNLLIRTLRGP